MHLNEFFSKIYEIHLLLKKILTVGSSLQVALQVKAEIAMETANWSREKTSRTPVIPLVRL